MNSCVFAVARVCLHIASVCLSIVAGNSQVADLCVGDVAV